MHNHPDRGNNANWQATTSRTAINQNVRLVTCDYTTAKYDEQCLTILPCSQQQRLHRQTGDTVYKTVQSALTAWGSRSTCHTLLTTTDTKHRTFTHSIMHGKILRTMPDYFDNYRHLRTTAYTSVRSNRHTERALEQKAPAACTKKSTQITLQNIYQLSDYIPVHNFHAAQL